MDREVHFGNCIRHFLRTRVPPCTSVYLRVPVVTYIAWSQDIHSIPFSRKSTDDIQYRFSIDTSPRHYVYKPHMPGFHHYETHRGPTS